MNVMNFRMSSILLVLLFNFVTAQLLGNMFSDLFRLYILYTHIKWHCEEGALLKLDVLLHVVSEKARRMQIKNKILNRCEELWASASDFGSQRFCTAFKHP